MKYVLLSAALLLLGCADQTDSLSTSTSENEQTIEGPYPAQISAVVSGEFHADDGGGGFEMIWLEGYDEVTFYTSSTRYDDLKITEGSVATVEVTPGDPKYCGGPGPCFRIE